jgi:hypothetical protein
MESILPPDLDNPLDEAVLVFLTASKPLVRPFEEVLLAWKVENVPAGTRFLLAGRTSSRPAGSMVVRPGMTTTYTLEARYGPFRRTLGRVVVQVEAGSTCAVVVFPQNEVKANILTPYWSLLDAIQTANEGIFIKKNSETGAYVVVAAPQIAAGDYDARLRLYPMDQFDLQVTADGILFSGRYNLATNFHPKISFDFTLKGTMRMISTPDFETRQSNVEFVFLNYSTEVDIPWYIKVWLFLLGGGLLLIVLQALEGIVNNLIRSGFQLSVEDIVSSIAPAKFRGLTSTITQNVTYAPGSMTVSQCPFP